MIECLSILFQVYVCGWILIVIFWMIISNFMPGLSVKEHERDLGFVMKLAFGWPVAIIALICLLIYGIYRNLKTLFKKV